MSSTSSATTRTTATVTAPATTSSVTFTYCMEEPDTPLTPHINEPPGRRHRDERKPSGQPRHPWRPRAELDRPRDNLQSSDAPMLDIAGDQATPATPRSGSPDSKANDSSGPQPRRRRQPKPKSKGTSDTQESRRNPANTKPAPNQSDSKHRRNQGRPGGGTTDADESKPPRRGKKTPPGNKDPNVDSEPIPDSTDAEPSPLKEGPSRQKRRGKFDGKLTTEDVEPRREERRTNPDRKKYRVDSAADDLTSRLIHDLRTPPYLDCAICFNPIRPFQPTWSCSPSTPVVHAEGSQQEQYCWATLHLKCVRSWASKSIADTRQAHEARGGNKPGEWLCIGCRAKRTVAPSSYRFALHWFPLNQH